MTLNTLSWTIEDGIGHLVLDQPPANKMTGELFEELGFLTREILPSAAIKALVIYGRGRHFSSGADLEEIGWLIRDNIPERYPEELPGFLTGNTESFRRIGRLQVPTFAAIRGTCLGSAMELALACQFRICGEGTVMGFPESSFGLMPGCGGSVKLAGITGRAKATELILSGRNFTAGEAYLWGIVHRIVPRKTVVEETLRLARGMMADC